MSKRARPLGSLSSPPMARSSPPGSASVTVRDGRAGQPPKGDGEIQEEETHFFEGNQGLPHSALCLGPSNRKVTGGRERAAGGWGGGGVAECSLPKENTEARCRAEAGRSGSEVSGGRGSNAPCAFRVFIQVLRARMPLSVTARGATGHCEFSFPAASPHPELTSLLLNLFSDEFAAGEKIKPLSCSFLTVTLTQLNGTLMLI